MLRVFFPPIMDSIDFDSVIRQVVPLLWIAGGWFVGWLVEAVLVSRLRKLAEKTT